MSIRRLPDLPNRQGLHKYEIRFRTPDGRQRKRHKWFGSDDEAREYEAQARGLVDKRNAWQAVVKLWVDQSGTTESYQQHVQAAVSRLVARIGDVSIGNTSPEQVLRYLRWRADSVSASAAAKDLTYFKAVARWARSQYIIQDIPFEHIQKPRYKKAKRRPIPLDRLGSMVGALDDWVRPVVLFIAITGCRQQDAATLMESDIEKDKLRLYVKGGDDYDYLLDDDIRGVIEMARAMKRKHSIESRYVFVNSAGSRWSADHLAHRVRKYWGGEYTLHSLRHTFATIAGKRFKPDMLQAGLAHKSRVTSETYTHLSEDADARHEVGAAVRSVLRSYLPLDVSKYVSSCVMSDETELNRVKKNETILTYVDGHKCLIPKEVALQYITTQ